MNGGNHVKATAECKSLRACGLCPRECVSWHRKGKEFCKRAFRAERRR